MTDETKELMEKARALLAAATPGPWASGHDGRCAWVDCGDARKAAWLGSQNPGARNEENAELMAAAPGLLATLCDENDALHAELSKVTAAHARESFRVNALLSEVDCMEHEDSQLRAEVERLRAELAQEASLRAELAAEVKRLRAFEAAELQRRAILDVMNGGEP